MIYASIIFKGFEHKQKLKEQFKVTFSYEVTVHSQENQQIFNLKLFFQKILIKVTNLSNHPTEWCFFSLSFKKIVTNTRHT